MSTVNQSAVGAAWRKYRVGVPGSVIPSEPTPAHLDSSATDEALSWSQSTHSPRTLLVTGSDALERRAIGFAALSGVMMSSPDWRGYWTAHDYVRNLDQLENAMKLARVTHGSDDVLSEAYTYEAAFHALESSDWLFLDMLSEAHLNASRAFELFHLLLTRASSSRFRTVVSATSVNAAVVNPDASRAFQSLFSDASLVMEISV